MKKLFLTILAVVVAVPLFCQNTMIIYQKDGRQFSYGFGDKPVITYTDNDLVLTTSHTTVEFPLSSLSKVTFSDIQDAVPSISESFSKPSLNLDEYTVCISGAVENQTVSLISSGGEVLATFKTDSNGEVSFSIANLPAGIYIIKSESLTCKILKK